MRVETGWVAVAVAWAAGACRVTTSVDSQADNNKVDGVLDVEGCKAEWVEVGASNKAASAAVAVTRAHPPPAQVVFHRVPVASNKGEVKVKSRTVHRAATAIRTSASGARIDEAAAVVVVAAVEIVTRSDRFDEEKSTSS